MQTQPIASTPTIQLTSRKQTIDNNTQKDDDDKIQRDAPAAKQIGSLFLFQAEAALLSIIVAAAMYALASFTQTQTECFMEIQTSLFNALVLCMTLIVFIVVSAFKRDGISQLHECVGQASIGAVFIALYVYLLFTKHNTICMVLLLATYAVIFFLPMMIIAFVSTPFTKVPPTFFTREVFFLSSMLAVNIIPQDGTLQQNKPTSYYFALILPMTLVLVFAIISATLVWLAPKKHELDIIPQILITLLIATYSILAYFKQSPFKDMDELASASILYFLCFSLILCVIYLIVTIISFQNKQSETKTKIKIAAKQQGNTGPPSSQNMTTPRNENDENKKQNNIPNRIVPPNGPSPAKTNKTEPNKIKANTLLDMQSILSNHKTKLT